ncbi:hypothetical protein [Modestobacter sp. VKM Ac-2985]|uniref:hypothetical protein n=1 Tax=Modestobacter sp. VKM Ac-2985 TaxID=3004139 RepID=UPI0022AB89DC|nr:hypothetical protein [Modestobacter sp. VKM Ac-2985]MCZ2838216.1 hypothetical protein [Modestobacter sp. VKM Ac-2985]
MSDDIEVAVAAGVTTRARPRSRLSQADMPLYPLLDLYPIPEALLRLGAPHRAVDPAELAQEMGESSTSSVFRSTTAACVAYGLTEGGAQADAISLTDLGRRLILPASAEEAHAAALEALQRPRLMGDMLRKYAERPWPPDRILQRRLLEARYPAQQISRAIPVINGNVRDFHLLDRSGDGQPILRIDFTAGATPKPPGASPVQEIASFTSPSHFSDSFAETMAQLEPHHGGSQASEAALARRAGEPERVLATRARVYLSVPVDSPLIGQLGEILAFGGYVPVFPSEEPGPALSPEIMKRMRGCSAAVVDLRPNLERPPEADDESLMRIGAAVALCGDRTVFLCPKATAMPAAVEHLPHVHYTGDSLDYESTMGLVRVFNKIGGHW